MKARISPASQLVSLAVVTALILTVLAGLTRPSAPLRTEVPAGGAATAPSTYPSHSIPPQVSAESTVEPSVAVLDPSPPQPTEVGGAVATGPGPTATPLTQASPHSTSRPTATLVGPRTPIPQGPVALGTLASLLRVSVEQRSGYDRSLFSHWIDADGDGCDTRREVLITEAIEPPVAGDACVLSGGRWHSLYDGVETRDPGTFDIDHVVALAEAWDSGAFGWSVDRRTRFANDLDVSWALVAVSATSNRQKSDQDPSTWLPPVVSVRCEYLSMWIAVKVRWDLAVDATEKAVLDREIAGCARTMSVPMAP